MKQGNYLVINIYAVLVERPRWRTGSWKNRKCNGPGGTFIPIRPGDHRGYGWMTWIAVLQQRRQRKTVIIPYEVLLWIYYIWRLIQGSWRRISHRIHFTFPHGRLWALLNRPCGVIWKFIAIIIDSHLVDSIKFHNVLHRFKALRGTETATLESKLLHNIVGM